jgi:hypothetical protein
VSTTDELSKRARILRNAAPREFHEFYAAFIDYGERQTAVLLEVTDDWKCAQGHAQQCKKILDVLEGVRNG